MATKFAYTKAEEAFTAGLVDWMFKIGYNLISGAHVSTEDVPFHLPDVARAQSTTLAFISPSLGVLVVFDLRTFDVDCNHSCDRFRPSLQLMLAANFKRDAHSVFRDKFFRHVEHATKRRLILDSFPITGSIQSKSIPVLIEGVPSKEHFSYFNSWEFRADVDLCGAEHSPVRFVSDIAPALNALDELTKPFTKIFMNSWPPLHLFPTCGDVFWSRFRENMDRKIAAPLLKAMRNT